MRYQIIQTRGLFIIYENDIIKGYYYTYREAEEQIRRLEYLDLMYLLMTNY